LSWAAAAALMDRTATVPNRIERRQRELTIYSPWSAATQGAAIGKQTFGTRDFPTPFMGRNPP
jgi:hypothetical protein